jgi:hypothetical protein
MPRNKRPVKSSSRYAAAPNFVFGDNLEDSPSLVRQNYEAETDWLMQHMSQGNPSLLQVGCMDGGRRILEIAKRRRSVRLIGLDSDKDCLDIAKCNIAAAGKQGSIDLIHGDITNPERKLSRSGYHYVACLNNTLGYIEDEAAAIEQLRKYSRRTAVVSVYGPQFTDELAHEYFAATHMPLKDIDGDCFMMENNQSMRRYTYDEVYAWGGQVIEMPMGYLTVLGGLATRLG